MFELCCLLLNIAQAKINKSIIIKKKKSLRFWDEFLKDFFFTSIYYVSIRNMFQLLQRRIGLILLLSIKMQSFRLKFEDIAKKNIDTQKFL